MPREVVWWALRYLGVDEWVHKRCSGITGRLKSNVDFHCRRCREGENGLVQSVLVKEVVIEPNVKLSVCTQVLLSGVTLGAGGGVDEAAKARVRSYTMCLG